MMTRTEAKKKWCPAALGSPKSAAGIAGTANGGTLSQGKGRKSSVLARAVEVGSL
jgi:hypothetical protein